LPEKLIITASVWKEKKMLAAAIGVSAVTFAATVMHLRSQKEIKPIALKEMWKIRAYQEHTGRRDIHTNF